LRAYPTPDQASSASVEAITSVLKQAGHTRAQTAATTIYQTLQQEQLTADAVTTRTKARLMLALLAQLEPLIEQIAEYDREIERLFLMSADSAIFASLPRAGKRLAPRLLAEIGDDRSRYADAASLQALAGTAPVLFQSGNYAKAHRRYACLKPLRNAMQQFAWQSTLQEGWALNYYRRKRAEGKSHSVALRTLANVWLRIIYAIWRDHTVYVSATFEAAQQLKQRKAA
jgi:transposase